MRNLLIALVALLCVSAAVAQQLHQATPVEVLIQQYRHDHPDDPMLHMGHDMTAMAMPYAPAAAAAPPLAQAPQDITASAVKSFNVSAHRFSYSFSPSPFVVNQGDTVTLTLTSTDTDHGFFLQDYMTQAVAIHKGSNTVVTFVANTPGTFTFFCTIFCGEGHADMSGTLTVAAQAVPPSIATFNPIAGPTTGGTNVLITGENFVSGAKVRFGSVDAASVKVNSATSINATAPAQGAGSVPIVVTNPDGQSATSTSSYTYIVPPAQLAISSLSPVNGSPAGGTTVTITGSGFNAPNLSVTFGGVAATALQVTSATSLTVITPPHAAGKVDVVVTAGSSSATAAGAFTYEVAGSRRRSARHGR